MRRLGQLILSMPLGAGISWFMILAMAWIVPVELWKGDYPLAAMAALSVAVSLVPAGLRRNYRVVIPWELEFLILLQLYLHTFWGVCGVNVEERVEVKV